MDENPQKSPDKKQETPALGLRQQAFDLLSRMQDRAQLREQLNLMREAELKQLLHDASVRDASPAWREITLRRFIRESETALKKGGSDGGQNP
ncbi:MAG: hypothetical protein MUF01_09600 [Bryobacterales bacterium]|jgi:hypothetical protein|nr:hypothetical protein [Bryobacterales bacterium]